MGKIILKLVGYPVSDYDIDVEENNFKVSDLISFLIEKGMSFQELREIKFIHAGKNIEEDITKVYILDEDENFTIYLYTNNMDIKKELAKNLFESNDDEEVEAPKKEPLPDKKEEHIELTKINMDTIKLFQEPDFIHLLNICINKPEYFNKIASYISHGNITSEIKMIEINDFKYNEEYDNIIHILQSINYNKIDENYIKNIINHFDGNINLTIRYIISH
jgi:hypothetical protein